MQTVSPLRLLMMATLPIAAAAQAPYPATSTLPPTQPTTQTSSPKPPTQSKLPALPNQSSVDQSPHRARVTWTNHQLFISADNSSLNQILREISRQTGMKITGGVRDERVFGTYGPAETGTVLVSLLTGTGSNMLLEQAHNETPLELVLTPRQGSPTPPSPTSVQNDDDADQAAAPSQQLVRPPMPMPPPTNIQSASETQSGQGQQPTAAPSESQPTGVRTPQQIYDQLMKLQQQKAATPPQF